MFGRNLLLLLPAFAFAFAAQGCGDGAAGNRGTGGAGGAAGHVGTGGHATGGQGGSASGGAGGAATGGAGGAASGGTGGAASGGAGQAGGGQGGAGNNGGASGQGGSSGASGGAGQGGSSGTVDGGSDGGNTVCPTVDGGTTPPTENDSITFVPSVTVSTVAGGASATNLANPVGVVIEPAGSLIVSDFDDNQLVRVALNGTITPLTTQGSFTRPFALAYDVTRNVLYAQTDADPSGSHDHLTTSTIWTINRGSGAASTVVHDIGYTRGVAVLSDGRLVLSDRGSHLIWLLDPTTGKTTAIAGSKDCVGGVNGTGTAADFNDPYGVAALPDDSVVVADFVLGVIRRVTLAGVVTTFAGDGGKGTIDGPAATARFNVPEAIAADGNGVVYVSDVGAHRIRRIASGMVSTVAGDGTMGFMDGAGNMAEFYGQEGITVSSDGSTVYVADGTAGSDSTVAFNRVRAITFGP